MAIFEILEQTQTGPDDLALILKAAARKQVRQHLFEVFANVHGHDFNLFRNISIGNYCFDKTCVPPVARMALNVGFGRFNMLTDGPLIKY